MGCYTNAADIDGELASVAIDDLDQIFAIDFLHKKYLLDGSTWFQQGRQLSLFDHVDVCSWQQPHLRFEFVGEAGVLADSVLQTAFSFADDGQSITVKSPYFSHIIIMNDMIMWLLKYK